MNDPLLPSDPAPAGSPALTLEALVQAHRNLRTAFHITLVFFIILTGSLFVFFLREVSIARRQITDLTQAVVEYEKSAVPLMEDFRTKLQGFTRTNPDFAPIYMKYFGTNTAAGRAGPTQAQPLTNPAGARLPPGR
jgi:hypothetical protein